MGLGLRFEEGEGPVLQTVRDEASVSALREIARTDEVSKVCETVSRVRRDLPAGAALIGFCGAPWTVASYMIEGGSSARELAKIAAIESPAWFELLIERLIEDSVSYLEAQISAGAQAVQIFDSWASDLAPAERVRWVERPLLEITNRLRRSYPDVPVILFARGIGIAHAGLAKISGAAAVGIESETGIPDLLEHLPPRVAVQGNLDPVVLLTDDAICRAQATSLAKSVPKHRHVFNLGHGIRPATEPARLAAVIDAVRAVDSMG
jgi:uroporphyrinogen decarboxylase